MKILHLPLMLLLVALSAPVAMANKCADQLFDKYKSSEHFEYVKVPSIVMAAGKAAGGVSDMPLVGDTKSMRMLVLENGTDGLREEFRKGVDSMSDSLEMITKINDSGEKVVIWQEPGKNSIKAFFLFVEEKDELMFMELKGNFKHEDMAKLLDDAVFDR